MKRILLITPMLHQGGFERICVMSARLLQKDFEVFLAVFSMEDIAYDISGLNVIDLNLGSRKGKAGKIINVFRRCIKLSKLQRKLNIDVSYSFGTTANLANALSFGSKKKISACHSFEEIKETTYMKLICHRTDKVFCCSKKMTDLARQRYGFKNIQTLWNPCDTEMVLGQSRLMPDEDISFFRSSDKVLVSMGREDDVKGFWHLLKIFRKINEEERQTRLAIIGEGNFEEYDKLAEELDIQDKVLFTGLKKNPFPYLRESNCYLLTSLSEGLPNALVEALALSLPIVSANCLSGPAEILNEDWKTAEGKQEIFPADFGILSPPLEEEKNLSVSWTNGDKTGILLEKSEEMFASAVLMLIQNPEIYGKYQKGAADRAADFSKEVYLKGLADCINNL